jgi:hypothetical protein
MHLESAGLGLSVVKTIPNGIPVMCSLCHVYFHSGSRIVGVEEEQSLSSSPRHGILCASFLFECLHISTFHIRLLNSFIYPDDDDSNQLETLHKKVRRRRHWAKMLKHLLTALRSWGRFSAVLFVQSNNDMLFFVRMSRSAPVLERRLVAPGNWYIIWTTAIHLKKRDLSWTALGAEVCSVICTQPGSQQPNLIRLVHSTTSTATWLLSLTRFGALPYLPCLLTREHSYDLHGPTGCL